MYTNTKTNTRQDKIRKQRQVGMSWIREGFSFAANESPKSKNKSWLDPSKWEFHSVLAFATLSLLPGLHHCTVKHVPHPTSTSYISTCLFVLQKPFCLPLEILFLLKYVGEKKYPQWLLPQNLMLISLLLSLLFASHHLQAEYGPQVNCECWKSGISEIKVVLFEICQYKVLSWNIEQLPSSMSSNLSNKSFLAQVHLPRYSQII